MTEWRRLLLQANGLREDYLRQYLGERLADAGNLTALARELGTDRSNLRRAMTALGLRGPRQ